MGSDENAGQPLGLEIQNLRARLQEAEETLRAIRSGEVDAVVVSGPQGAQVYTLKEVDHTYRLLIERMKEGAVTLTTDGAILYCNRCFGELLKIPLEEMMGSSIHRFVAPPDRQLCAAMLQQGNQGSAKGELTLRAGDGTLVPVYLSISALQLDDVSVLCAVATDLSEQRRHKEIVASERLARAILDQAAEAIVVCDEQGRIIRASQMAHQLCGQNPILQPFEVMFPLQVVSKSIRPSREEVAPSERFSLTPALRGEHLWTVEASLPCQDGQVRSFLVSAGPLLNAQNDILGCVVTLTDITERKQAEEALRRSERELALRNQIANIFLTIADDEMYGEVLQVVLEALESKYGIFGYVDEHGALICPSMTRDIWDQCQVSDKDIVFPRETWGGIWGRALIEKKTFYSNKNLHVPKGHISVHRAMATPIIYQGEVIGYFTIANKETDYDDKDQVLLETIADHIAPILNARLARDRQERERKRVEEKLLKAHEELERKVEERTAELVRANEQLRREIEERKRTEEALQESEKDLRFFSSQLLAVKEQERKRIVRELHDGIGQSLTAIKFGVERALEQTGESRATPGVESLEATIPFIQEAMEEVRRIGMDLRPSILDDLGILATISWLCREFQTIYLDISIEKQISIQEDEVPGHLKTVIYRILQEALNNVAKHSKADLISLYLRKKDGPIELEIKDNGLGFDLKDALSVESSKRGFGLASMRERTELSGGSFAIQSVRGAGTIIQASWPRE